MVGQVMGEVIHIDFNTRSASRRKFVRITLKIALDKPLCLQFLLDGRIQKVEYESLPINCFNCGKYGHVSIGCPENGDGEEPQDENGKET